MRAAIYTRVSTAEQVKGHSIEGHRVALEAWAAREGWDVVAYYSDPGISAKNLNRPGLQAALADAARGTFDLLLVKARARYSRDIADAASTDKLLARFGVRVMSHDEPASNEQTPSGYMVRGMTDVMSGYEREELAKRVKEGLRTKAVVKGLTVGHVPFGYRRVGDPRSDAMQIDDAEAQGVRWAFEAYAAGSSAYEAIADGLMARGLRPHSMRGREGWSWSTIRNMLKNRVYLGEVVFHGVRYPGAHEAIVTPDVFDRVQEVAARRRRAPRSHSTETRVYLLNGLANCGTCGSPLWANAKPGRQAGVLYRYYRCSSRHARVYECSDGRRGLRAEAVEARVERAIVATAAEVGDLDDLIAQEIVRVEPVDVDRERARLEGQLRRATQALVLGGDEATA